MKRVLFFILVFVSFALYAQNWSVDNIPFELIKDAKAVVQLEEQKIELTGIDELTVSKDLVITIFEKEGDDFAFLPVFYDAESKVKEYDVRILDAFGEEIKDFKKKEIKDITAVDGNTLYGDDRMMYFEYHPSQYPYTVVFHYKYESKNTAFLPRWNPIRAYEIGVLKSQYSFINQTNIPVKDKTFNFSGDYKIQHNYTQKKILYTLESQKPIEPEVLSPDIKEIVPYAMLSPQQFTLAGHQGTAESWETFGKWMYNDLIKGRQELPDHEKMMVMNLIQDLKTPKEKVKALYQYMQNKTRYINVAIGIGGWQPFPASNVSEKGYGDCKALSNYMVALLNVANIPSNYTVIYGDNDNKRDIQPDFPSMQGNHVIVQVPLEKDTLWLENTSQKVGFNHLGRFTGDRKALAINRNGGFIIDTQRFSAQNNIQKIQGRGNIDENGHLHLKFTETNTGVQYDDKYMVEQWDEINQKNWIKERFDELVHIQIQSLDIQNDRDNTIFKQNVDIQSNQYAQIVGDNLIFRALPIGVFSSTFKQDSFRKLPLYLQHAFQDVYLYEITLPQGYQLDYQPDSIAFETEFGSYQLEISFVNGKLNVERNLTMHEGTFPKEKYNEFVHFIRNVEKFDNTNVLFQKIK